MSCFVSSVWSGMASCSRRCCSVQVLGKESRRGIKDSSWTGFPASDNDCFHTLTLWHLYTLFSKHVHFSRSSITTLGTRCPESLCFCDSILQNRNSVHRQKGKKWTRSYNYEIFSLNANNSKKALLSCRAILGRPGRQGRSHLLVCFDLFGMRDCEILMFLKGEDISIVHCAPKTTFVGYFQVKASFLLF